MGITLHRCPHCGAEIKFDPETQGGKCEFCLSEFSVEEVDKMENLNEKVYETNLYNCPRCGAEIIADNNTTVTFCCYCNGPVILSDKLVGDFRQSKIIPFKYTKERAIEEFLKWSKGKWFLPKEFASNKQLEKISGVYIPFWLLDSDVTTDMVAEAKKIKTWTSGQYRYTKTDVYKVYRIANLSFNDVPGNASSKMDDDIMESIEPFNKEEIKPFSMSYLPGFISDKYDKSKEQVLPHIKDRIKSAAKGIVSNSIKGYSTVNIVQNNTKFNSAKCDYALLPVWMLVYSHNGKNYTFAMNGDTGKIFGELPLSKVKLAIMFIIVVIITFVGGYILC